MMVIRPPRASYELSDLGPPKFRIQDVLCERVDLGLINDRGQHLACSHYFPSDRDPHVEGGAKLPCVVYVHGHASSRLEARDAVEALLPCGIALFCLDLSGSGLSDGDFVSLGHHEESDIRAVLRHLRGLPSAGPVGLWGRSMGAVVAVYAAAKDPLIAACVLDSPFSSFPMLARELTNTGRVGVPRLCFQAFYCYVRQEVQRRADFDIEQLLPILAAPEAKAPALFVVAKDDVAVGPHHTHDLHNAWGGKDKVLVTIEGGHGARRPEQFMKYLGRFLTQRLVAPAGVGPARAGRATAATATPPAEE